MASILAGYIDLTKIDKSKITDGKNGQKFLDISISINDESRFGRNASISIGQSKDEREAKQPKVYVGNAKVVWTDGTITKAVADGENVNTTPQAPTAVEGDDDLPF